MATGALDRVHHELSIHAPDATSVRVVVAPADGATTATVDLSREGDRWTGVIDAELGDTYWLEVDGSGPLLDPSAWDVVATGDGPRSVLAQPWPRRPQGAPLALGPGEQPVVYEMHVRQFARTFGGVAARLDHLVDLGIDVIELMPVHPFDATDNQWGYMPWVWGAVHREYADQPDAAADELARLVAAAHERGLHVWLDVVLNHTGEGDASLPTLSLRGIDDRHAYRRHGDGTYTDDSGCGNDVDPSSKCIRALVLEALDRFADLGIDGFRFDLASLLTRDGGELVARITEWARRRGVALVAEPWDLGAYQVGVTWPEPSWRQWNDRFREDVRGFLRGEPGLVTAMLQRVQGSPDLFGDGRQAAERTVNFLSAHDGLTLHDLTIVTSDRHRSWACPPELQRQQLRNYLTVLLLSAGTAMFVMGDEVGRTQGGHDNPYDIDGPLTWFDWQRAADWRDLHDHTAAVVRLRRECPIVDVRWYGTTGEVDGSWESRSLAWATDDLYVMVNAWWEPLTFEVQEPGEWDVAIATAPLDGLTLAPRSVVALRRRR